MANFDVAFNGDSKGIIDWKIVISPDVVHSNLDVEEKHAANIVRSVFQDLSSAYRTKPTDNNKPVLLALENARHELSSLHGLIVTDTPDDKDNLSTRWTIDTTNAVELIDNALKLLT